MTILNIVSNLTLNKKSYNATIGKPISSGLTNYGAINISGYQVITKFFQSDNSLRNP
ncbi:hypothetical protein DDB_G0286865 [Dictyostelium discoideum AX4]|uniref:Uncharacterized protein DDB_G0286865 n=1 Tax=Dictyostelium discoideum TaxID=44689 RepID=Y7164_DICDI|nr:hypothetical protein DDB_G0286865 [Dictyostelium discoideum AX4]Q54L68.1 RecName: Full=Uncharacterized protein DDB_G0286865 [Dictyostelium discoideum]EAL63990.1 hypothetical protein DDB_G0286865 [Dictyostelium discoideum AX4]|eukprot:XP_637495.1 hypothetical protein DDB_G0286865 [Dictyostelium discoideum AX4]